MNRIIKKVLKFLLITVLVVFSAAPVSAAEVRRVPDYDLVGQGLMALTLDVEGSENFRYTGLENKMHSYRGKIKPESKLKFVIKATLAGTKNLPITGRSCSIRMQIVAKKNGKVIKTQNYKKDNKSNLFLNYTAPKGADTIEVSETFILNNKSKNKEYNKQLIERNKLILTTSDVSAAVVSAKSAGGNKGATGSSNDKQNGTDENKVEGSNANGDKTPSTGLLAGGAAAVAAIGGGAFFFMKKRKADQAANEERARTEQLRQQEIQRQQELQQQNLQRRQEEINQHNRTLEEERLREQERLMKQQREAEQQRLIQEQNTMHQQPETGPQPGAAVNYVAGAAGVTGNAQSNATENPTQTMPDAAPRFCQNCGTPLKPGTRFCENCGTKV